MWLVVPVVYNRVTIDSDNLAFNFFVSIHYDDHHMCRCCCCVCSIACLFWSHVSLLRVYRKYLNEFKWINTKSSFLCTQKMKIGWKDLYNTTIHGDYWYKPDFFLLCQHLKLKPTEQLKAASLANNRISFKNLTKSMPSTTHKKLRRWQNEP